MRKKGRLLLAALSLLLAGCGEKTQESAEDLQARYAQTQGYEAVVEVAVPREDETLHYTLSLEHSNGEKPCNQQTLRIVNLMVTCLV